MNVDFEQLRGKPEELLADEIPESDGVPTLSGDIVNPLQLCRVLTKDSEGRLVMARARYIGRLDGGAVFVDRDNGRPLVVPEQSIDRRSVGVLPEPSLPSSEKEDNIPVEVLEELELRRRLVQTPESITEFDNKSYWGS